MRTRGGGQAPMWTSTQKFKIRVHRLSSSHAKKLASFLPQSRYKLVIKITNSTTVLNKLQSYSRISALGPVGHCTSHFKRADFMSCISCISFRST